MSDVPTDEVEQTEHRARLALASGSAGDGVQVALDQLVADRTNGEPLDTALRRLRDALDHAHNDDAAGPDGSRRP